MDDHPVLRHGIAQLIDGEQDLNVCGQAATPTATLEAITRTRPDLVVVDLQLAGASGLSLIKDIKAQHPDLAILVLSMHDESFYAERTLRAGATGYVMKQEATDHILDAIRQVLCGQIYLSERLKASMLHRFIGPRDDTPSSPIELLTDRELEVFQLLGQGLPTREIAAKLFVSVKTVETHLEHIKTRLGLESGREVVRHAMKWSLEGP